ncbi:MAG: methylenetetrahydrofolate reductase [Candidatus Omnitrophica bacterium]|nr:methylenetetrahydrofolate reductase [Candidatus Omnitrophota bacterium]
MSKLQEKLEKHEFVVTSEIGPPKGTNIEPLLHEVEEIKDRVTAINVTDNQSSVMRFGSLATCRFLKERGVESVYQLVTRDRNRIALQSDLLSAYSLGVENVLCLTGDHPFAGDHPEAMPVYDIDSVQLIKVAQGLTEGKDMMGNQLDGAPKFFLGGVVNPGADPIEPHIIRMEKKVEAGARFFQTQPVYEVDKFARFMEQTKHIKAPILAGIVLLKSAGMAKFMNENVAGVFVPQNLIDEMKAASKEDRPKKSIEIAVRLIKKLKSLCPGVHIMPLGWDKYVPAILDGAGL